MRTWPAVLCLALVACGSGRNAAGGFPELSERRASALRVTEVARSASGSEFTQISGLDVDSEGRIYVGDWFAATVSVLDPTGAPLRTIGRKGLGPGEFRSIRGVQVLPGDSLLVYDPSAARLSVFPPDAARPAYVVNLVDLLAGPAPFLVWRTPSNQAYLARFSAPFTGSDDEARRDQVRAFALDGAPLGEPLRTMPTRSFLQARQGGSFSVTPNPFGHNSWVAMGPGDAVHFARSDSLGADAVGLDGRPLGGFGVPYQPPPVTRRDVDRAMAGLPPPMASLFRPVLEDSVPQRWPAGGGLLVDEAGTVWLRVGGPADRNVEWASFSPDGRYLRSAFLPPETHVLAVRAGRLYGRMDDEEGFSRVVVYHLR